MTKNNYYLNNYFKKKIHQLYWRVETAVKCLIGISATKFNTSPIAAVSVDDSRLSVFSSSSDLILENSLNQNKFAVVLFRGVINVTLCLKPKQTTGID